MALVTLTRQTETLQGFQLTSPADMVTALTTLANHNYSGDISCVASTWTLRFQNPAQNIAQSANINDWIILENGQIATVCPAAQFSALYSTA